MTLKFNFIRMSDNFPLSNPISGSWLTSPLHYVRFLCLWGFLMQTGESAVSRSVCHHTKADAHTNVIETDLGSALE